MTHPWLHAIAARWVGRDPGADLILHKTGRPPNELRSYRFFVDVAAPSIGGATNPDFWSREVPRLCRLSPAIWHAAISLSSAHESYVSGLSRDTSSISKASTLQHFNAAIRELTGPSATLHPWEALTASTLFTCISILEGQLEQATIHFKAGCKLLGEAQNLTPPMRSGGPEKVPAATPDQHSRSRTTFVDSEIPVSLASVQSVLLSFEIVAAKLDAARTSRPPSLLVPGRGFSAWERYQAPLAPPVFGRYLNGDNLTKAVTAAESLFMTLVISTMVQSNRLKQLFSEGGYERLQTEPPYQDTDNHIQAFKELQRALLIFRTELLKRPSITTTDLTDLRKAYLSLSVIHGANRLMLMKDPEKPDQQARYRSLPSLCEEIVNSATELFLLESKVGCLRSGGSIPNATVMNPVTYVVKCGFNRATREEAVKLLEIPRIEGIWDSHMAASIARSMLARETAASQEYRLCSHLDNVVIHHPTARGWNTESVQDYIHPLARICNYSMKFKGSGGRDAILVLRTWKEWLEASPGTKSLISW